MRASLRVAALVATLGLSSCLSVGPQESVRLVHYEIDVPAAAPAVRPAAESLTLRPFSQDPALDREEIRYRISDVEGGYWGSHLWSRPVAAMLRESLQSHLQAWGGMGRVVLMDNAGDADFLLTAEVHRFGEVDREDGWSGVASLTVEVTRASDGKIVYHRTFLEEEAAEAETVVEVVRALGRATGRIFDNLREDLLGLPAGMAR